MVDRGQGCRAAWGHGICGVNTRIMCGTPDTRGGAFAVSCRAGALAKYTAMFYDGNKQTLLAFAITSSVRSPPHVLRRRVVIGTELAHALLCRHTHRLCHA